MVRRRTKEHSVTRRDHDQPEVIRPYDANGKATSLATESELTVFISDNEELSHFEQELAHKEELASDVDPRDTGGNHFPIQGTLVV